jgi:hypothetical protein
VSASVDGNDDGISRIVAWSRASATASHTPGFGVADASQMAVPTVDRVDRLAPDQPYFLQVQTVSGQILSYEPITVSSCNDTHVVLTKTGGACVVTIDGGAGEPCTIRSAPVG